MNRVELTFHSGVDVSGIVVDAQGRPVGGAAIETDRGTPHFQLGPLAIADAEGRFRVEQLVPYYRLRARAEWA